MRNLSRNLSSVTALLLLFSLPCFAQGATSGQGKGSAEQQVQDLVEQRRQAAVKGDAASLDATTADDYVRVSPNGQLVTKAEFLEATRNSIKYQSIEETDVKIQVFGNTAVITSVADLKGTVQGQDISGKYRVTQVFVKRGGKWLAVHFHATLMK
jgi:ketosteroid isomerase-like protein